MIQEQPQSTVQDQKPDLDPQGLKNWLAGTAGAMGAQASAQKAQNSGFNLGQAIALGSGNRGKSSIFTPTRGVFS